MPAALPQSVARRAEAASALIRRAAGEGEPAPKGTPAATPQPASADVATLQRQLAETQENLRRANAAHDALQGKYNAEVPRAQQQLREAQEQLRAAQSRVTELEELMKRKVEAGDLSGLTDEDRRLMGADLVKVSTKIAREVAGQIVRDAVDPLTRRVDENQRMTEAAYWAAITEAVPDWETVNDSPEFMAWLNAVDPVTQRLRFDLLKRAEAARQGHRIVEIFRAFKERREIGALMMAPQPQDQLRARTAPAEGGTGDPGAEVILDESGKRIWTRAQIAAHYREKQQGLWRGEERQRQWRELEIDIAAANAEGRIRG